jgi:hypothetical protein
MARKKVPSGIIPMIDLFYQNAKRACIGSYKRVSVEL